MSRPEAVNVPLGGFRRVVRAIVRAFLILGLAGAAGVALIALLLARDGFDAIEGLVVLLLLAAPALVLFFGAGVRELAELPERLLRMPQRGAEHVDELRRIGRDAQKATWRRAPLLAWRLRRVVGSARDLVGIALPLRLFAPPMLALTLVAVMVSSLLVVAGLIAFLVLAVS